MLPNNKTIAHQSKAETQEQNQAFFPLMTRKMKQGVLSQLIDIKSAHLQDEEAEAILEGNTWHMTWEQFRLFKDGGKRSGTVAITRERFIHYFKVLFHYQAAKVWDELKSKGILSEKNKLNK